MGVYFTVKEVRDSFTYTNCHKHARNYANAKKKVTIVPKGKASRIEVYYKLGDWWLSSNRSMYFTKAHTQNNIPRPPEFVNFKWIGAVKILCMVAWVLLMINLVTVLAASYWFSGTNRRFWPLYNALQILVYLVLYEERIPPMCLWGIVRIKDYIELNIIPRKYLGWFFENYIIRVIYNSGGMMLCFSLPVYIMALLLTFYAFTVTDTGSVCNSCWTKIGDHLIWTGVFRLSLINFLPLLIASGFAHRLGTWSFEYITYLLTFIILDLLLPLVLGTFVEVSELHTPEILQKFGNLYSNYEYFRSPSALYSFFWMIRRLLFVAALRTGNYGTRFIFYMAI
jgi:hypothetical protein